MQRLLQRLAGTFSAVAPASPGRCTHRRLTPGEPRQLARDSSPAAGVRWWAWPNVPWAAAQPGQAQDCWRQSTPGGGGSWRGRPASRKLAAGFVWLRSPARLGGVPPGCRQGSVLMSLLPWYPSAQTAALPGEARRQGLAGVWRCLASACSSYLAFAPRPQADP